MPRRGKKTKRQPQAPKELEAGTLGHHPFTVLKGLKIRAAEPEKKSEEVAARPAATEEDEFKAAMAGVTPLCRKSERVTGKPDRTPVPEFYSEDLEVLARLQELVSGRAQFDLADTDEYVEGYVRGLHPVVLERLRRGRFSVQAHLDLHGLTLKEAAQAVRAFITESVTLGYRCVLLIHGRGHGSKDQIPVLKKELETLLLRGPARKQILAFTSARPHDGGAGASYVLLRAR
ncbi:MAG: Smr/MutS family protein [Thermodesulfobacteriota bacterium]